jgi:hypothetical protein
MCIQAIAEDVFLVLKLIWKQVTISKWRLTKYVFIFLQRYIITTTTMCETVDYIASSLFQPVFRLVLELILLPSWAVFAGGKFDIFRQVLFIKYCQICGCHLVLSIILTIDY